MQRYLAIAIVTSSLVFAGCSSGGNTAPTPECTAGTTVNCTTSCNTLGTRTCGSNGVYGACAPPAETCNAKDDNCNGQVDEGINCSGSCTPGQTDSCVYTNQSIPGCTSVGTQTCSNQGQWSACTPPAESCNNQDDDCDGQTDENLTQQCSNACGQGTQTCQSGQWGSTYAGQNQWTAQACSSGLPSPELCDGKDNDCDQMFDEGDDAQALVEPCPNTCLGGGTKTCQGGNWSACTNAPGVEICDGIDNDCNNVTDDVGGSVNNCQCSAGQQQACGKSEGECNPGTQTCINGVWSACGGAQFNPEQAELCDGLDNDCDGDTDEGNPEGGVLACGTLPTTNCGGGDASKCACSVGLVNCVNGQLICQGGAEATPETCDFIDNDCDGEIDEGTETGDQYEGNDSCSAAGLLGTGEVIIDAGMSEFTANLFPDGDVDWYSITAKEAGGFLSCFPGSEQSFSITVTLTNLPEDFDLFVWPTDDFSCSAMQALTWDTAAEANVSWVTGTEQEQLTLNWTGECGDDDSRTFMLRIENFSGNYDCQPYTLQISASKN